jgi:raffinose/stachyose/melibiose transport system permease protein
MKARTKARFDSDIAFNVIGIAVFIIALFLSLYPVIWMVLGGFRSNDELFSNPVALPLKFDFSIFQAAWVRAKLGASILNSLINSFGAVLLTIALASPAAFALARMRFPGRALIVRVLLSSIIISGQLILIPLFFTMKDLGFYDTLLSTIIGDACLYVSISTMLFYSFFQEIPYEIEEAAIVDGCGKAAFYFRFILPLSRPAIAAVVIFTSLWSWNEYLFALTFLKSEALRTLPLRLQIFFGQWKTEYNYLFATLSISVIPLMILYLLMQKSFIKGLTAGAIKT